MRRRRNVAVGAAVVAALLSVAVPAQAEGSFSTYMSNVRDGFDSRTWTDHNHDTVSTHIKLSGVTKAGFCLELARETPWYQPDENRGIKDFGLGSTQYYGRQPSGNYRFGDVSDTCGGHGGETYAGQTHSASYVGVWY